MREDSDADKYIRLMASETEGLRRLSIARGGGVLTGERADPAFRFPGPGSQGTMINEIAWKKKTGKEKDSFDTIEELSKGNMERNKLIRPAHPHPPTPTPAPNWTKDRAQITAGSSASTRGKRTSRLLEGGVILSDSSFYKHIDYDFPESERDSRLFSVLTPYAPLYTSGLGLTSGDGVLHKSCEDTGIEDQPSICATDA
ncbi:hypothetical protein PILCRDRAFT_89626 [Piloderma croceum F 1598]|uniref:Uncharacterized protein n=1 Tax=Piloderma croceum (strain F 1598) TaxID=765440 RepID=A0A0C3F6N1_PILCF|nr:hypothetical protein PILCRDRAFT_89626 [Piloderma croceum F 1598]